MEITRLDPDTFDWAAGSGGARQVRQIAGAAAAYDGREPLNEAAVLRLQEGLATAALFLAGDDPGGEPGAVGFAYVHGLSGGGRPELDLVVAPQARGRGVGTRLAAAVADELPGIPLTAWSHGNHPAAAALAARSSLRAVRELWVMRRPAALPLPQVRPPGDYRVRPFRPGADDAAFLALNAAAFADHPEQGALDEAGLAARIAQDWFDAEGFLVAERWPGLDGALAGFHWTKVHTDQSRASGEVYVIGVAPSAQGTGLGRHLLRAGIEQLHRRGVSEVLLYVEAGAAAAIGLYESFGFVHAPRDTDVLYAP